MDYSRLEIERRAMGQMFPQFNLFRTSQGYCWIGTLETDRNNHYEVQIEYPPTFPHEAPTVKPINPVVIAQDRAGELMHQYPNGKLCLFYPGDRTLNVNTTAAQVVAMAATWFFAYECWVEAGKERAAWPGPSMEHKVPG